MRHVHHFVKPAPYLVEIPAFHFAASRARSAFQCPVVFPKSCNWSGYAAYQGHSYNVMSANWDEPQFASSNCSTTAFTQWTGIGGFNNPGSPADLGQDGTAFGVPDVAAHEAWIEAIENNNGPLIAIDGLKGTPGQEFSATVYWDSSISKYSYTLNNDYTGDIWTGTSRPISNVDLSSAEVIAERPKIDNVYYDLTNYQQFQVTGANVAWGSTGSAFLDNLPSSDVTAVDMYNGEDPELVMSAPGALNSSDHGFTNHWYHCVGHP